MTSGELVETPQLEAVSLLLSALIRLVFVASSRATLRPTSCPLCQHCTLDEWGHCFQVVITPTVEPATSTGTHAERNERVHSADVPWVAYGRHAAEGA